MSYISCSIQITCKTDNFNIKGKSRKEITEYIIKYLNLPQEDNKKYYKYISDETAQMLNKHNINTFNDIVNALESNKIEFDSKKLSPSNIKLLIACCRTSSQGHKVVLNICKEHFIFSSNKENIFNESIIKSINISEKDLHFLKTIYTNYDQKSSAYHDLIVKSKYLSEELSTYNSDNNFTVQSKLNTFLDEFKTAVQVEYHMFPLYPIINNLQHIAYDSVIDVMIGIYTSAAKESNYHEDKMAALSIIFKTILQRFNTYKLNKTFMFCEKLPNLIDSMSNNKTYEYIKTLDISNIYDANTRKEIKYLQQNIDETLLTIFKIYIHTEAVVKSKGDPTEYIKSTQMIINTFYFSKNEKILQLIKKAGETNILSIVNHVVKI